MSQDNCFFPVNMEKEEEEEEKVEEEEEDEIRTIMQSSIAMQQSCSRGLRQLFLSGEGGGKSG